MTSSAFSAEDAGAFHFDARARLSVAWPQYASLLLCAWLFVSAFILPYSRDACAAAWIMGSCMGMTAFAGIFASPARYFNLVLGAISLAWQATAASHERAALVNGVLVSALVLGLCLVPRRIRAGTRA
jgi:hypothetical protein